MRVESESNQHQAAQPPWSQSVAEDVSRSAEQQWRQQPDDPQAGGEGSTEQPGPSDVSQPHSPFPIQVDPALNPPPSLTPSDVMPDQDSFPMPAAYIAPPPPQPTTRSGRTRGNHGSAVSSRARTDLLSPNAAALFRAATAGQSGTGSPPSPSSPTSGANGVPRLPPILQVEKQTVTTTATQAASASRRRNEAMYQCPVPGCGSTFTRRFNLRGHLRSHTEERPYVCEWPGCGKGFARQHDCKRHYALHSPRPTSSHVCQGCGKSFSRTDALNRHLRSDNGAECRAMHANFMQQNQNNPPPVPNQNMLIPGMDINGLPGPHTKFNGHNSVGSVSPAGSHSPMPA